MPEEPETDPLKEIEAMTAVYGALSPLSPPSRARVLAWASGALHVTTPPLQQKHATPTNVTDTKLSLKGADQTQKDENYNSFSDLLGESNASTDADKALVGGYWIQVVQGSDDFFSQAVNEELKNTGNAVGNITRAFDSLKATKPQLVRQLEKTGKTQQARKRFKLTTSGIQKVERMIRGQSDD